MIITTTMMAAAEAHMYVSVFDAGGAAVGATVGWASWTLNDVIDDDGQYAFVPAKFAITVKSPGISGTQVKLNVPAEVDVVVPISRKLPLESTTEIVTGTPVKFVGNPICW